MTAFRFLVRTPVSTTIVFLALFLYIFNILPPWGPEKLGTREYFSLLASFWILFVLKDLPKTYYLIILANYSQVLFSLLTVFINGTTDFWYVQFVIRNVLYINGAVAIAYMMPKSWSFNDLLILIVLTIIVNDFISLLGFLNPAIRSFILSIQSFVDLNQVQNTVKFGVRIVGIGQNNYFRGGVINGMGIILVFYLISKRVLRPVLGMTMIGFMTIVGLFIARTTIIGFLLGILLFAGKASSKIKLSTGIVAVLLTTIVLFSNMFDSVNTSHAFEIFYKIDDLDKVHSLHHLRTMYDRNMSPSTLLIGDGLSKEGGLYYGQTDVGYMRNILYFGLIGTIFGYLYYEYFIFKKFFQFDRRQKNLIIILVLYLLILNLKSLPDYNFFVFLLMGFYIKKRAELLLLVRRVAGLRRKVKIQALFRKSSAF